MPMIEYDIPPYLTDFSPYFHSSLFQQEMGVHGGFADIYSCTLGRQKFALKVLRLYPRGEEMMRKNFNYEINSWLKVGLHENILQLSGICYTTFVMPEPQPCLVSCWQENGKLNEYLKRHPESDLLVILHGVFAGLKHMHGKGVIHGDLRGGNILVSSDGTPRLADFGLSKLLGEESSSSSGTGTLRWMAKEMLEANPQASGKELSSRRSKASDIWSTGMTILELLSGRNPYFNYDYDLHVIQVIVRGEKPEFPGILHEGWKAHKDMLLGICERCWVDDPLHRPDASDLLSELSDLCRFGSVLGSEDSGSDDTSLTPRARPQDDHESLVESIASLSLSNPGGTSGVVAENPIMPSSRNATEAGVTNGSKRVREDGHVGPSSSTENNGNIWSSDDCAISYMTAFLNHLASSKRFRKHAVHGESEGPPHAPIWTVSVSVDGVLLGIARGPSKKIAQEVAAKRAFVIIEKEEIDSEVSYLPIFMNRLKVRGSYCLAQFQWRSQLVGSWSGKQCGGWESMLYREGTMVGRGKGVSEDWAKGEAARAAALVL